MKRTNVYRVACVGLVTLLLGVPWFVGCGRRPDPVDDRIRVTVSIPPQRYFVEQIGGDRVWVEVMVGAGSSPATYEPKPSQLRVLSESAVYFRIGVPFEDAWMPRLEALLKGRLVVHVADGQADLAMDVDHGAHDHHHDQGLDPHTWLSPRLASGQAAIICDTLCQLDPKFASTYRANLDRLQEKIRVLDRDLADLLAGAAGRRFMVFHPSWGYFARDYSLEQVPIEVGGQEPSAQEMAALVQRAKELDIQVLFVQPEFDTSRAETIARTLGGGIIRVSPLAENWPENLRVMGRALAEVLDP